MAACRKASTPASTAALDQRTIPLPCARTARASSSHLGAREIVSAYQVHGTTAVIVSQAWPADRAPAGGRAGHQHARHCGRRADGRLRAGAVRRPQGSRRRSCARGLARRPGRHLRGRRSPPWKRWGRSERASAPPSVHASARRLIKWVPSSRRSSSLTIPPTRLSSPLRMRRGGRTSICRPTSLRAWRAAGVSAAGMPDACTLCRRARLFQLSPLAPAQ